jgi:hypothetical protein
MEYTPLQAQQRQKSVQGIQTQKKLYYHKVIQGATQPAGAGIIKEVVIQIGFCHHKMSCMNYTNSKAWLAVLLMPTIGVPARIIQATHGTGLHHWQPVQRRTSTRGSVCVQFGLFNSKNSN